MITKHTDLEKIRIKRDESDVTAMVELLENNWTNPFGNYPSDHVSISTGTVASPAVSTDLLPVHEKGEHACKEFEQQRIQKGDCFHDPIKKINLKTFSAMKRRNQWLFGNMVIIAQSRKLEMRDVMFHPVGPLPWTLSDGDGTMKKTNKAVFQSILRAKCC